MEERAYIPGEYASRLFNEIPLFEDAKQVMQDRIQEEHFSAIRGLFHRHGVQSLYGLIMLHRHFEIDDYERVVEFRGVATPWPMSDSNEVLGGRVVPRCWGFFGDGELHPTEFGFQHPGGATLREPEFRAAFVKELYDLLAKLNLERHLGLTVFDSAEKYLRLREEERTIGRVSITIPVEGEEPSIDSSAAETAWTFGCQRTMDNSARGGRICWVCYQCAPKPK